MVVVVVVVVGIRRGEEGSDWDKGAARERGRRERPATTSERYMCMRERSKHLRVAKPSCKACAIGGRRALFTVSAM